MSDCVWPISYSECDITEGSVDCFGSLSDPNLQADFEQMAIDFLSLRTGGSFGLCEASVRPCREGYDGTSSYWGRGPYPSGGGGYYPALIGGKWYNLGCGSCSSNACACTGSSSLRLPGPIASILNITIDGVLFPSTSYRVDNYNILVRTDGSAWPDHQDLAVTAASVGSWVVNYVMGRPVPIGGQVAAGLLACEFAKAACRDKSCALPQRIKDITRQGVSVTLMDDFKELEDGRTGIWLIDSWVASVMKAPRRSQVLSPDIPRPHRRRQTWPPVVQPDFYGGNY